MRIKYFSERERADGSVFVVNPPKYVKEATGLPYKQFKDKDEAVSYALRVADVFQESRRGNRTTVYVDETSVSGLINHFKTTQEWLDLKPNSKANYRMMFKTSADIYVGQSNKSFGEVYAKNVDTIMADRFYQTVYNTYSHHRANSCVKVMRRVWNICLRHGKVTANPFQMKSMAALPSREIKWDKEEVLLAIETSDRIGLPNLGTMILMCYQMCQRPGDIRQLTWGNLKGDIFEFRQEKTGTKLTIDAGPDIMERLSKIKHRPAADTIITNDETGGSYGRTNYSVHLRKVRKEAGLRDELKMSDLRRTGATEMGESGCTEDEIMSVTGHTDRTIVGTYVLKSHAMARSAMKKRFG